jgi:hypothetical protein
MKIGKVLSVVLVCGSLACELSVAAEADRGATNVETAHDRSSADRAASPQDGTREPARDNRRNDQRPSSGTEAEHERTRAHDRGGSPGDQRSANDTEPEHDRTPAHGRGREDSRPSAEGSAARTGSFEGRPQRPGRSGLQGRPQQVVRSRSETVRPNGAREVQADSRMASHLGQLGVGSSRESVTTANVAQSQQALAGFRAADRSIRGVPAAASRAGAAGGVRAAGAVGAAGGAGAIGGAWAAGGSGAGGAYMRGPAVVGGPASAKIANSGTINGTAARPRF